MTTWQEGHAAGRGGVEVYYKCLRKGSPWLVFLHGGTGSMSALFLQERFFSKKRVSLLFIDMRGHGYSGRGRGSEFFRIGNFAADVNAVLRKLKIGKAVVIGHCFGSFVAQQFAKDYPGKVERLVLINSANRIMKNRLVELACLAFFSLLRIFPYHGRKGHGDYTGLLGTIDVSPRRVYADIKYCGFETYSRVMVESLNFRSPFDKGREFRQPALLIHGKRDFLIGYERTLELSKLFENPRVELLNTNHVTVINDAANVNKAILNFVNQGNKKLPK